MHKSSYQIILSEDEANTLYVLTGSVCGNATLSPRKHCSTVYYRLHGMLIGSSSEFPERKLLSQGAHFSNYPVTKTPQQLKIEELENTIKEAQKQLVDANQQLEELKGL